MAAKTDLSRFNCSLARALGAVGDWWTLLIVRDAFFGATRFSQFQRSLGIARNILSARLDALVAAKILTRTGPPARPVYLLTEKGRDMLPALVALMQWGDKWESANRPPVLLTDASGRRLQKIAATTRTGHPVTADTIRFVPGPGATRATRAFFESRPRARPRGSR
jgi:DNA-binding HxlR family transcriptional regulator